MKIFKTKIKDPYKTVIYSKKNNQLFNIGELALFNNNLHKITNVYKNIPKDTRFFVNYFYYDIVNETTNETFSNISQLELYKRK
jgi:hypothetical protein